MDSKKSEAKIEIIPTSCKNAKRLTEMAFGTDLRKRENPFRELLVFCFFTLIFALAISVQSIISHVNVFLFIPLDVLFLLTLTRSYQLVQASETKEKGKEMRVRDLSLYDRLLIALHFIGFSTLIGLAMFFLHLTV